MAENNTGILEELKKATQQVQQIAEMDTKQRAEYLEEVSKQFFELQKTVHGLISEEGIILNNFEWEWISKEYNELETSKAIEKKAQEFAMKYGFSKEAVLNVLKIKNDQFADNCSCWGEKYIRYYMLVPKE